MTLPQKGSRDGISVLRNAIAKPNRFAADATIIFVKNTHDIPASLAFTAKSAILFTFCRKPLHS